MSDINDGGPAFPVQNIQAAEPGTIDEMKSMVRGMTLRDYFAAKAMQGLLSSEGKEVRKHTQDGVLILPGTQGVPMLAYEYADAMLKERDK